MIKIVNRLLILVIIIGGIWFLAENWNSDEEMPVEKPAAEEINENFDSEKNAEDIAELKDEIVENIPDYSETETTETPEEVPAQTEESTETTPEPAPALKPATAAPQTAPKPQTKTEPVVVVPNVQTDVRVYLYEWDINLINRTFPAGTILFEVINTGRFSHSFAIEGVADFGKVLPGTREEFIVDLTPGVYQVFSPREVDLHYDMNENIVVEER